jgi:hypothetical protein
MVCKKSSTSGSFVQKVWGWVSRKEVKRKFFIEMDEREVDNVFGETFGWDASVFTGESVVSTEPKPKRSYKQSKSTGEQARQTVRKPTKKNSSSSKIF